MKRIMAIILAALLTLACAGCGRNAAQEAPSASEDENDSGSAAGTLEGFPWTMELLAAETKDSLHTVTGVRQYDGSTMDVEYDDAPADGDTFLILTLAITKTGTGGGTFDWAKLSIQDPDGNSYLRMENDTFLQNHNYNRMAGTPLQIGVNEGSVCFEIPAEAAGMVLTLWYDAGEMGTIELPVRTN